jgi:diacylglycerol kinase (ATP)
MRVILLHNPEAGDAKHRKQQLMAALARAGHHATYQSTKEGGFDKVFRQPADLVVAAGGDGTVAKVASRLVGTGVPLSVLPLGTANNLARSLGFFGSAEEIIAHLGAGKKRAFDVGIAQRSCGKRYFFEAAGGGLLADYVRAVKGQGKKIKRLSKEQEMACHVSMLRRLVHDYPPQTWKLEIDGEDISGRYVLWEAMNIRSIGPGLYLASQAATKDGQLDFVCAREGDRSLLMEHLDARLAGKKHKFPLPIRKFHQLEIAWGGLTLHFDDKPWPRKKLKPKGPGKVEIAVKRSALVILRPAAGNDQQT